ncbi:MAG: FAD-dependent oxidoreductase [Streptosporangiaceae bacterium]
MPSRSDGRYDVVVIGAGPAGEAAAALGGNLGYSVALVERDTVGGTVVTSGGAPTKTFREAAVYLSSFEKEKIYGVALSAAPEVMYPAVRARAVLVSERLRQATLERIRGCGVHLERGEARLEDSHTVVARASDGTQTRLHAERVIIATGSAPLRPASVPFDDPCVWTGEYEFLGDVRHGAADQPEGDPVRALERDGLERGSGEPGLVHRRVMLGQDHVGAALEDLELARHGAGGAAQVGRGDHIEHGGWRSRDLDAEGAEGTDPAAPAGVDRQLAGDNQVITQPCQASCRCHRRCAASDHARQPTARWSRRRRLWRTGQSGPSPHDRQRQADHSGSCPNHQERL